MKPCPIEFKNFLLEGDFWRTERYVKNEVEQFLGLHLHRSGAGDDGQIGANQFDPRFLEFLESSRVGDQIKDRVRTAEVERVRIRSALAAVEADCPEEADALRYYLVPHPRRRSVIKQAAERATTPDTYREWAVKAVFLVWDEIGGVWSGLLAA